MIKKIVFICLFCFTASVFATDKASNDVYIKDYKERVIDYCQSMKEKIEDFKKDVSQSDEFIRKLYGENTILYTSYSCPQILEAPCESGYIFIEGSRGRLMLSEAEGLLHFALGEKRTSTEKDAYSKISLELLSLGNFSSVVFEEVLRSAKRYHDLLGTPQSCLEKQ